MSEVVEQETTIEENEEDDDNHKLLMHFYRIAEEWVRERYQFCDAKTKSSSRAFYHYMTTTYNGLQTKSGRKIHGSPLGSRFERFLRYKNLHRYSNLETYTFQQLLLVLIAVKQICAIVDDGVITLRARFDNKRYPSLDNYGYEKYLIGDYPSDMLLTFTYYYIKSKSPRELLANASGQLSIGDIDPYILVEMVYRHPSKAFRETWASVDEVKQSAITRLKEKDGHCWDWVDYGLSKYKWFTDASALIQNEDDK